MHGCVLSKRPLAITCESFFGNLMSQDPARLEILDARLINAICLSDVGLVKQYLEEYPDSIHKRDREGDTALHWAVSNGGNIEICQLLISAGIEIEALNGENKSALCLVVMDLQEDGLEEKMALARLLIQKGAQGLDRLDSNGLSVFHLAILREKMEQLPWLVELGVDVNVTSLWGVTPLHFAARSGNLEIIRFCIQAGADLEAITVAEESVVDAALYSGKEPAIEYVMQALKVFKEKKELDLITQAPLIPNEISESDAIKKENAPSPSKRPISL